jgi:endonuclease/exonuclease/phosphatase family metal-dependent hydrolase
MRKLSFPDKIIFLLNSILTLALCLAFLLPFLSPKLFPQIAVLGLVTAPLILVNILFVVYWLLKLKRHFLLSSFVLVLGIHHFSALFGFSEKQVFLNDDCKIMSYNVRLFNAYKWSTKDSLNYKIYDFIKEKDPDILAIQEFYPEKKNAIHYPYQYLEKNPGSKAYQALYSNYKITNQGSLGFQDSGNNAIFIDVLKNQDTLRIYNVHLQSFSIDKNAENFGEKNSEKLLKKLSVFFKKQAVQTSMIEQHVKSCPYKTIITGDFNNNAFSWVYRKLATDKEDAFINAGSGFGKTFDYFFPMRIDFILVDESITINNFKSYPVNYSDHYPIMARVNITN